jgi:hypothetical protein
VVSIPHWETFSQIKKCLKNLLVQTIQTLEQQKWAAKLQGFSFEIFYKPGKSNLVVDALSRKHADFGQCSLFLSVSSVIPTLISRLQRYYKTEKEGTTLLSLF